MKKITSLSVAILVGLPSLSSVAQINFSSDFESATAITEDNWRYAVNYFSSDCSAYESSPYAGAAQDNDSNISALVTSGGSQKMNVFSNYGDENQATKCLEVNVFQEKTIETADIGTYTFKFDSEVPGDGAGTADNTGAFIKVEYNNVAGSPIDTVPGGSDKTMEIEITSGMVGQILQYGFYNTSYSYQDTGVYYDNVSFTVNSDSEGPTDEELAEAAACADTSVIRFEDPFGAKDGNNPDVTCLTDTYVVPTGAESWAGFGDTARGDYYPFEFPYGGTLTFEGSATTETDVEFLFQTAAFPDNEPEVGVVVRVAAGGEGSRGRATYSVDIPASDNSYGNLVFYVGTNGNPSFDNPVTISNIVIAAAAAPATPAPAAPVPALPFWALLGLAGLVGLFGFRRR